MRTTLMPTSRRHAVAVSLSAMAALALAILPAGAQGDVLTPHVQRPSVVTPHVETPPPAPSPPPASSSVPSSSAPVPSSPQAEPADADSQGLEVSGQAPSQESSVGPEVWHRDPDGWLQGPGVQVVPWTQLNLRFPPDLPIPNDGPKASPISDLISGGQPDAVSGAGPVIPDDRSGEEWSGSDDSTGSGWLADLWKLLENY